jgi:hypothetical protein
MTARQGYLRRRQRAVAGASVLVTQVRSRLRAAVTFRVQWRWRIPATRRLAAVTPLAGTITATTGSGQPLTLTPGTTWSPRHVLRGASRRAILIHLDAREIHQIMAGQ